MLLFASPEIRPPLCPGRQSRGVISLADNESFPAVRTMPAARHNDALGRWGAGFGEARLSSIMLLRCNRVVNDELHWVSSSASNVKEFDLIAFGICNENRRPTDDPCPILWQGHQPQRKGHSLMLSAA